MGLEWQSVKPGQSICKSHMCLLKFEWRESQRFWEITVIKFSRICILELKSLTYV